MTYTEAFLDRMVTAYIETALWSSMDGADDSGGAPLDDNYGPDDIDVSTLDRMRGDCESFLDGLPELDNDHEPQALGHDLWLTRNGHGAGFWDGDYPEPDATILDEAAKAMGEVDLYVGDDGTIDDGRAYLEGA